MADESPNDIVRIVVPVASPASGAGRLSAPAGAGSEAASRAIGGIPRPIARKWAPAWFYSTLSWLGQSYYDASNAKRGFNLYLAGADVDPYRQLGATRLFVIESLRDEYILSLAIDVDSEAPLNGADRTIYPRTDAGILQMYEALAASEIFASVTHCYVPGRVDLAPSLEAPLSQRLVGYDPATGLRRILLGSAIAQVIPVGEFGQIHNEQVYDESPAIVPLATSLVYDVTTNNAIGATTFVLPVAYVVDQAVAGRFAVNRFGATAAPPKGQAGAPVDCGQTAVFTGGPGYDASQAVALQASIQTIVAAPDHSFVTQTFADTTAFSTIQLASSVIPGVSALTCTALSPLSAFSKQRIVGFYRETPGTRASAIRSSTIRRTTPCSGSRARPRRSSPSSSTIRPRRS